MLRLLLRTAVLSGVFLFARFAHAQQLQVFGRVLDKVTREAVADANITLYTPQSERYRTVTDTSGLFFLSGIEKGQYQVAVEKSGFVLLEKKQLQIGDGPVTPVYELQFSEAPKASLRGRILDSQGKPLAKVESVKGDGGQVEVKFRAAVPITRAALHFTTDTGSWDQRKWQTRSARVEGTTLRADLPRTRPLVYFLTLTDERKATVSTEHALLPE